MSFTQLDPPLPVHAEGKGKGYALAVIDYGPEHNLIWVTAIDATGEIWCEQSFRRYTFSKVQKKAGLKGFSPYSLRHTCATLLLLAGENPKIVAERMGHSTIKQTMDTYSHVLPTMQAGATEKLSRMLCLGKAAEI